MKYQEVRNLKISAKNDKETSPIMKLGEQLCKLTPSENDTRCYRNSFHTKLNHEDQAVFDKHKPEISKHLSRTIKFVPTGKCLSKKEIEASCAKFAFRLVSRFKNYHFQDWFDKFRKQDQNAGVKPWKPKKIKMNTEQTKNSIKQYFKSDTWKNEHSKSCIQLQHLITNKTEKIKKALYSASKIQKMRSNFSSSDRKTCKIINKSRMLVNSTDKNCGTIIISMNIFIEQVLKHLKDNKGTFCIIKESNQEILAQINRKFEEAVRPFDDTKKNSPAIRSVIRKLREWNSIAIDKGKLCSCYILAKVHKPPDENGVFTRLIIPGKDFITVQASNFLHSQVQAAVCKHNFILKDSSQLIAILDKMVIEEREELLLNTADVTALYPSINIEDGLKAFDWFMELYLTDCPLETRHFMSALARWVLQNNFIEFEGVKYHQLIGTAMGTIFSVMFANIFMLHLESPIINKYKTDIQLYKRFIDDIKCIWKGSKGNLCKFKQEFNSAHPNIKLTWSGYNKTEGYNLDTFQPLAHVSVNFMDVSITLSTEAIKFFSENGDRQLKDLFHFRVYRKKCNAYAYIPFDSFHPKHNRIGWFRGVILWMLIRCSVVEEWREECKLFKYFVLSRGHRRRELEQEMQKVTWSQRKALLEKALVKPINNDKFFEQHKACVLSIRRTPKWEQTRQLLDLDLTEFQDACGGDIFPKKAFCTFTSSPSLRTFVPKDLKITMKSD